MTAIYEYDAFYETLGADGVTTLRFPKDDVHIQSLLQSANVVPATLELQKILALLRPTAEETKEALKSEAKRISQELERGGFTLITGARIDTTAQGQGRIGDAESWLKDQPEGTTLNWNDENDTWHTVDLAAIQHIKQVAGAFVQACFDARKAHYDAIDALTDMAACHDYAATQLQAGWPADEE